MLAQKEQHFEVEGEGMNKRISTRMYIPNSILNPEKGTFIFRFYVHYYVLLKIQIIYLSQNSYFLSQPIQFIISSKTTLLLINILMPPQALWISNP